ncbi:hypothetical protein RUM43_014646 [Polyplax serrata]|uniref:Peptidase M3A/M3B catalytic domain-containing protein n=1 Tax=Polyplax serrata TaxID=468196 RepID=A0AAN8PIC6_POLSC
MLSTAVIKKVYQSEFYPMLRSCVSTWSPLGVAFNTLPSKKSSLSLSRNSALFGVDLLSSPKGFEKYKDEACDRADKLVQEVLSTNRSRKIVDIFDDLSDTLCQVADLAEFVRVAHPDVNYRAAAEVASGKLNGVVEKLNTYKPLYDALKNVVERGDVVPTTEVDNHVSKLFLFDFEQSGIHLPETEREKVVDLNEKVLSIGQYFMRSAEKPKAVPMTLIPESIRNYFYNESGNAIINGLFTDSPNELMRELAYKYYLHPDAKQEYLLNELLNARHSLADTCGFLTYSHRAIKSTVADTPDFVSSFLNKLNSDLKQLSLEDIRHLSKLKKAENPSSGKVKLWDVPYYRNQIVENYLKVDANELSSYFSLGACMEGINNLTEKLYGISLICEETKPREVWSPDVYKLAVVHETEGQLGHIYCDFYQRADKPNQDCHFMIRGGRELMDGSYQNPIVVIMLNLPVPQWSSPCLLLSNQLSNVAHEMGHALHSMLARTKHQHVTGTRCCTDFAEVPSILMEYFIFDPRVMKTFAKHFQTKEPLSYEIIQKFCDSRHLLCATETHKQVLYSALDQKLHGKHPLGSTSTEIYYDIQQEYSVLDPVPNTAWQLRFSHLVGYGAKYYSYLLSTSIASSIWQTYFKDDPFSREQGERFRQECLRHGGGKPARNLINDYLKKDITPEIMADALLTDIDRHRNLLDKV